MQNVISGRRAGIWLPKFSAVRKQILAPSLLPLHSRIVFHGDSITAARGFAGFADWALFYCRGKFFGKTVGSNGTGPTGWNQGVVGNTSTQGIARLSNVTAENPAALVLLFGCNDITNSGGTFASITANLRTLIDAGKAAGSKVVICTIIPGASGVYMEAMETIRNQVNAWILALNEAGVYVADTASVITDIATQLMADGKHPNGTGAQLMGQVVATVLNTLIVSDDILYDPAAVPAENLYANSIFAGGTTSATSWSFFNNSNGLTKAASKTTVDGYNSQRYVASGTASANSADNFNQSVTITGGVIGDRVEAWVEVLVEKVVGISGISISAGTNNSQSTHFSITSQDSAARAVPFRGVMRAPASILTSNNQVMNSRISIIPANAAVVDADVKFLRAGYRKVPAELL